MGKVGAPYGNRNAEKWSFRKAIQLFHEADKLIDTKHTIKVNNTTVEGYKFDFIGEVASELGTFKEAFIHLSQRFPSLKRLKNQLDTKVERNCYSNTKKGLIKEATGIVNLKANWKWSDRQAIDHTTGGEKINIMIEKFKPSGH